MRVKYNSYSHRHGDQECDSDLGLWLDYNMGGGIEEKLRKIKQLTLLFTEDMLVRHPERIGKVADILDASGTDHKLEADSEDGL